MRKVLAALVALLLASCQSSDTEDGERRVVSVPSSIPSNCSRPVDAQLGNFLARVRDGTTVVFAVNGCYLHERVIVLKGRNGITVEGNGATFKKQTVAAPDEVNSLNGHWRFSAGSNLTIRNATIEGKYLPPQRGTIGQGLNYEHGVAIWGTQGATVSNVSVSNVEGDCVIVDPDVDAAQHPNVGGDYRLVSPARDVLVDRLRCAHAARQGFASTHAERVTLKNSRFVDIQQNGVDIEIDHPATDGRPSEKNNNIKIFDNSFEQYYFSAMTVPLGQSPDVGNIEMRRNKVLTPSDTCYPPIYVGDPRFTLEGIFITDNELRTIGDGIRLVGVNSGEVARNTITYLGNHACANASFAPPNEVPLRQVQGSVSVGGNTVLGFGPG